MINNFRNNDEVDFDRFCDNNNIGDNNLPKKIYIYIQI